MPKFRKTDHPPIQKRESKYDNIIAAAKALRIGEWLEVNATEYTSPENGRVCVRQALNRSPVLNALRYRKEFSVYLLLNKKIGIQARRPR